MVVGLRKVVVGVDKGEVEEVEDLVVSTTRTITVGGTKRVPTVKMHPVLHDPTPSDQKNQMHPWIHTKIQQHTKI